MSSAADILQIRERHFREVDSRLSALGKKSADVRQAQELVKAFSSALQNCLTELSENTGMEHEQEILTKYIEAANDPRTYSTSLRSRITALEQSLETVKRFAGSSSARLEPTEEFEYRVLHSLHSLKIKTAQARNPQLDPIYQSFEKDPAIETPYTEMGLTLKGLVDGGSVSKQDGFAAKRTLYMLKGLTYELAHGDILSQNNGKAPFEENPAKKTLQRYGITFHPDNYYRNPRSIAGSPDEWERGRRGSNGMLQEYARVLPETFELAREMGQLKNFFEFGCGGACLDDRYRNLVEFRSSLETMRASRASSAAVTSLTVLPNFEASADLPEQILHAAFSTTMARRYVQELQRSPASSEVVAALCRLDLRSTDFMERFNAELRKDPTLADSFDSMTTLSVMREYLAEPTVISALEPVREHLEEHLGNLVAWGILTA